MKLQDKKCPKCKSRFGLVLLTDNPDINKWELLCNNGDCDWKAKVTEKPVMPKIVEAFERYLRSEHVLPSVKWDKEIFADYNADNNFKNNLYRENRIRMGFGEAAEFAKTKLFEKIIKETFDSNFSA